VPAIVVAVVVVFLVVGIGKFVDVFEAAVVL